MKTDIEYHNSQKKATSKAKKEKRKTKPSILLNLAVEEMTDVLRRSSMWHIGLFEDGEIRKTPATIRGNKTYAYYQRQRLNEIQGEINKKTKIDGTVKTNAAFITCTDQYEISSADSIHQSWLAVRNALPEFCKSVRRLGVTDYIVGVEAFRGGGCHAHIMLIFNRQHKMYETVDEDGRIIYRLEDIALRNRLKTLWANALKRDIDQAHCDIQAVWSQALAGYITKELKKAGSCEEPMKRLRSGEASPHDEQTVLAFYLARRHKMRLLRVSKGLRCAGKTETAEGVLDEGLTDLIQYSNKSPMYETTLTRRIQYSNKSPMYETTLTRRQLLEILQPEDISPYTGLVDRDSKEYRIYRAIFNTDKKINDTFAKIKMERFAEQDEIKKYEAIDEDWKMEEIMTYGKYKIICRAEAERQKEIKRRNKK
jgi:hypothetical protein